MRDLTEKAMSEGNAFAGSFLERVELLKSIPVSLAAKIVEQIPLDGEIAGFIRAHGADCYIVTGNLDVWTEKLVARIGLPASHFLCSRAVVWEDRLVAVDSVMDKGAVMAQFSDFVVAVGDGSNDVPMIRLADIGIGYGGVRAIAPELIRSADHLFYDPCSLVAFLEALREGK